MRGLINMDLRDYFFHSLYSSINVQITNNSTLLSKRAKETIKNLEEDGLELTDKGLKSIKETYPLE